MLTDHGADPKLRAQPVLRTPLEEAIVTGNRLILRTLLIANRRQSQLKWEKLYPSFVEILNKIPDFSFEINWECDSVLIPFLKKWTPSDTYYIYKRGDKVRVDFTLVGWNKLKCIRGNLSALFKCNRNNKVELLIVDHGKHIVFDLFSDLTSS